MILQWLYAAGRELDRALSKALRLPAPVISVGNIASGGRAKTPVVIELCRRLSEAGRLPIVLTRGYGRRGRGAETILPGQALPSSHAVGDEALEVALLAEVPVLVGARRGENALRYWQGLNVAAQKKAVFVLDDGFQHWKLRRDLDVVLVAAEDFSDRLLPSGRLRERATALKRARCVLELEKDLSKRSEMPFLPSAKRELLILTTRAPDPHYREQMAKQLPGQQLQWLELADHAAAPDCWRALRASPLRHVVLGFKEAVKILPEPQLRDFAAGKMVEAEAFTFYPVRCRLYWQRQAREELGAELLSLLGERCF